MVAMFQPGKIYSVEKERDLSHSPTGTPVNQERKALLLEAFGKELQEAVPLASFTSSRIGGLADYFLMCNSSEQLEQTTTRLWEFNMPFKILGGGSNILVSERGVSEVVVLNRSHWAGNMRFDTKGGEISLSAESGVNFGLLARRAAELGCGGLEWASGIPGTLGGAVVGNAGAHGGDMAGNLVVVDILHRNISESGAVAQRGRWKVDELEYSYRSSIFKRKPGAVVVLGAELRLQPSTTAEVKASMAKITNQRRRSQPPGASMGSMFRNPVGDYAGRLIEAAGLKGASIGDAEISTLHANFFINRGKANADDVYGLICLARNEVAERFGVVLELEIELWGSFDFPNQKIHSGYVEE